MSHQNNEAVDEVLSKVLGGPGVGIVIPLDSVWNSLDRGCENLLQWLERTGDDPCHWEQDNKGQDDQDDKED